MERIVWMRVDVSLNAGIGDQRVMDLSSDLYAGFLKTHVICKRKRR